MGNKKEGEGKDNSRAAERRWPVTRRLIERYPKFGAFVWGPIQGAYTHFRPGSSTAVSELYQFAARLVGIVFGAIHCAAWTASFPSALEKGFWRVSAVIVTAYPAALFIPHGLGEILCSGHIHEHVPLLVQIGVISINVPARFTLLVLGFSTLRAPDIEWFAAVDLTALASP
ncbi:hypothetical protein B0H17DRAFT_1142134 [Mycena rosella]|uniref:Uncharacterized protein n=1 Tax=Mycena rosella TaxID=1033263 RepID=A0AAD7G9B4_MYCRO|nr:hypothetical protein B0H17DRAFT_1142134 [Mycena rosella]